MRQLVLVLLVLSLAIPTHIDVTYNQSSSESSIIYIDTNGTVTVGAWFYYNVSRYGFYSLENYTVIDLNETHITYVWSGWKSDTNATWETNHTMNLSYGVAPFWVNLTLMLRTIENRSDFRTYIVEMNETYIYLYHNTTDFEIHEKVWLNELHIIVRKVVIYIPKTRKAIEEREETKLLALWSPNLNITQGNETASNETYTNETTNATQGGEGFWGWLFKIDTGYIVLGLIVVGLALGYWWFSREVQKSVGTEAELK